MTAPRRHVIRSYDMYPWRRILIPTDFSTASEWVFDDAVRLAGSTGAEIVIVHVRRTWSAHPSELRLPADPSVYEYAENIELERLRGRVRQANSSITTRLVVKQAADAGNEIANTASEEQADLIVIATHARHHVAHLLVGSTTLSVMTNAPAPTLAIRYGIRKRQALKRLAVPVHLMQTSHPALELARAIAAHQQAEIHLLTVCSAADRGAAERRVAELDPAGTMKRNVIEGDNVEREIIRYAEKLDADALFLNAREQPGKTKIDIIRHSSSPVFIVPGNGTQ